MTIIVSVDIGTTSLKAMMFDQAYQVIDQKKIGYPTIHPDLHQAEQDPETIYRAVVTALTELKHPEQHPIDYIVFSNAMHSIMAINQAHQPLTPLLIWSDNRAIKQIDWFKQQPEAFSFFQKTGTPIHPMSPFAKLLWFKRETGLIEQAAKFIGMKEYIWFQLTGSFQVDYSTASATGLFNHQTLSWDEQILQYIGIEPKQLPDLIPVQTTSLIKDEAILALELITPDTKLMIGASDGVLANLAIDMINSSIANMTVGTSGAIRLSVDKPILEPEGRLFCYYLSPKKWVVGGAVNNGGNVLKWLDQLLFEQPGRLYQELEQISFEAINHQKDPLLFLPHLNGERAPFWDSHLTGQFYGLTTYHQKRDLIRAAVEGIFFNLYDVYKMLVQVTGQINGICVSGGLFTNTNLIQLAADIFGVSFYLTESIEQSSLGAAMLVSSHTVTQAPTKLYQPNMGRHDDYQSKYHYYQKVLTHSRALKPS
ncbi:gluconokinase [Amphibacillus sediminis]|uniref:gluconokinase n=1 Tax=Amphibacillus sediminis TaxID=360185 RepID=UPI000835A6A4|nr:gluconokinase [Amphibacillus sediminis]